VAICDRFDLSIRGQTMMANLSRCEYPCLMLSLGMFELLQELSS